MGFLKNHKNIILITIVWFIAACFYSYYQVTALLPLFFRPFGSIVVLITISLIFYKIDDLRKSVLSLGLRGLILLQVMRITGLIMIYSLLVGEVGPLFALPVSISSFIILILSFLLLRHANELTADNIRIISIWNWAGIIQLVLTWLLVGSLVASGHADQLSGFPKLPLNLFPSFFVPFSALAHFFVISWLRENTGTRSMEKL